MAAEQVETTRRYLRCCGRIDPRWIEPLAGHLIKRTYSDLHWEGKWASAVALERLTLFGLVIVAGRPVRYGPIDADASRQLLIEHGLVEGDMEPKPAVLLHNEELLDEVERLQAKLRRRDIVVGQYERFAFYDERLPAEIYDGVQLARWLRESPENARKITMTKADLLREGTEVAEEAFPDQLAAGPWELPLDYKFEPGDEHDGVTVTVPLEALNQVEAEPLAWLVPGLLEEKVLAMIRSLPKALRTHFVPVARDRQAGHGRLRHGEGNLRAQVARALSRIGGVEVSAAGLRGGALAAPVADERPRDRRRGPDPGGRPRLGRLAAAVGRRGGRGLYGDRRSALESRRLDHLGFRRTAGGDRRVARPAGDEGPSGPGRRRDVRRSAALGFAAARGQETRFALRRLFLLAAGEGEDAGRLAAGAGQGADGGGIDSGLRSAAQLAELLAARAWPDEAELPRTKAAFEAAPAQPGADRAGGAGSGGPDRAVVRGLSRGPHALDAADLPRLRERRKGRLPSSSGKGEGKVSPLPTRERGRG